MKNKLLRKIKNFFKRNSYAIAVSVCVLLVLTMISVTALNYVDDNETPVINQEQIPDVPTGSDGLVLFTTPIENGQVYKEYADNRLLEDKTTGFYQTHQAIDYIATEGTKVLAVFDGTVEKVENSMMDGVVITIKHSNDLKSVYKCLGDETFVKEGDNVTAGQEIGVVGTNLTEKADGAHLHFELYENNKLVDPTPYFSEEGK